MKRALSVAALILAAVMMMTCLAACGKDDGKKISAGTYQLTVADGDSAETYKDIKDSLTLVVEEDGTAEMQFAGVTALEMTFHEDTGKVSIDGAETSYKTEGNKITIEDSTGKLVFEK